MRQPLAGSTMAPSTMFVTPKSVAEANRQEQLAKWETSETNRVPSMRRPIKDSKVQFTEADVFLSACLSGDLEEVQTLLDNGADINTCTVDGLTALHQAVIDGKPEMVQFLCDHGADLNAQDNEGWTPLHAAACCGNLDLVEYLCMEGADISVTNSDKELAVDLAEEDDCRIALEEEHRRRNVDPDECRNREMMIMRRDAEEWLRDGEYRDRPHSRTGASALHVAAAKGYTDVMRIQLRAGADVNCRDRDGWTPLHAAAHWGEREAATLLVNNGASFNELTNNGESVLNVADKDVVEFLEALQEKERTKQASSNSVNVLMQTNTTLKRAGSVSSVLRMSTEEKLKKTKLDEQDENKDLREGKYSLIIEEKSPSPSVECCLPYPVAARESSETPTEQERSSKSSSTSSEERSSSTSTSESKSDSAKWPEAGAKKDVLTERVSAKVSLIPQRPDVLSRPEVSSRLDGSSRLENAMVSGSPARPNVFPQSKHQVDRSSSERSSDSSTNNAQQPHARNIASPEVVSSRTPSTDSTSSSVLISRPGWTHDGKRVFPIQKESSLSTASPPESPLLKKSGSFVTPTPPTEPNMPKESEAERRSKAKRQRDSRRSTQGVTREQLRAATASVLREGKENDSNWSGAVTRELSSTPSQESTPPSDSQSNAAIERKSVASNEQDTRADVAAPSQTSKDIANVRRRSQAPRSTRRGTGPISLEEVQSALDAMTMQKDGESPVATPSCSASSSLAGFTATTSSESSSNPLNSAITRVTISGKERPLFSSQTTTSYTNAHPSRFITTSAMPPRSTTQINNLVKGISANSETSPNYKEMYEKERQENERLRRMLEEAQEKSAQNANGVNGVMGRVVGRLGSPALTKSTSTSSIDDNERRSYERRIAELEYEIKQLEHVRTDNQKLKEENGALIRVISKLSK